MQSPDHDLNLKGSPDRFGYQWSTYSGILPESKAQLERWLGSTALESFLGKRVLDVGCGMGRNPYWYMQAGAASVLAIDMDDGSLAAARQNLASFSTARVEKLSAHDLDPSVHGTFDRVTCIGVLHHLADHESVLRRMWNCVAPGGELVLWCYAREGNRLILPAIESLRAVGSRMPIGLTHAIAKGVALLAWPAIQGIPWRTAYYQRLRTLTFKNVELIIFDQMLPHIAHYWTRSDMDHLASLCEGGQVRLEFVQENSWHACIKKA